MTNHTHTHTARAYFAAFGWDVLYSEYRRNLRNAEIGESKLTRREGWAGQHDAERECLCGIAKQIDAIAAEMVDAAKQEAAA